MFAENWQLGSFASLENLKTLFLLLNTILFFAPRYLCPFTPSPHLFLATITKTIKSTLTTITIIIIIIN